MSHLLCPSMNCANFDCLRDEVRALDAAGADIFHLDICDGELASRWSMGLRDVQAVRRNTNKLVDVHLYVNHPSRCIEEFARAGADILYVFPEAEHFISTTLCQIRELGKHPGLGIGWGATVQAYTGVLPLCEYVMVNIADPVAKARIVMPSAWDTLEELVDIRQARESCNYKILIDGAVSPEVMVRAAAMGVDGFAMGTQCLFGQLGNYDEIFSRLRTALGE